MAFRATIGVHERVTRRVFHNSDWKEYLDSLQTDDERRIACDAMDWVKWYLENDYPDAVLALNGELKWEKVSGK